MLIQRLGIDSVAWQLDVDRSLSSHGFAENPIDFAKRVPRVIEQSAGYRCPFKNGCLSRKAADTMVHNRAVRAFSNATRATNHYHRRFFRIGARYRVAKVETTNAIRDARGSQPL